MTDSDKQWYYDTSTGQVTQGTESGWDNRMGPYTTREEAERAIEIAKARNEAADAYDEAED
ncbi:SPOR domain-containing protein [Corynebacterium striatum]|uniref:SPOR domain-containing protein n=1 Tax=Corynebacterium striatum TaxID=43770 RepID=UPI003B5AE637